MTDYDTFRDNVILTADEVCDLLRLRGQPRTRRNALRSLAAVGRLTPIEQHPRVFDWRYPTAAVHRYINGDGGTGDAA